MQTLNIKFISYPDFKHQIYFVPRLNSISPGIKSRNDGPQHKYAFSSFGSCYPGALACNYKPALQQTSLPGAGGSFSFD